MLGNKEQAMMDFLSECPALEGTDLYFFFAEMAEGSLQFVPIASERAVEKPFIDGSISKRYDFTIIDYQAVNNLALTQDYENCKSFKDFVDFSAFMAWIKEQNKLRNYPDFGDNVIVDTMYTTSDTPNLQGIENEGTSPILAQFSFTIRVEYLDIEEKIF